jgi:tetratricopeptide (TPR) repeat protein
MGEVVYLNSRGGVGDGTAVSLGTLRHLTGMSPDEFAAAVSDEAGEPVPTFVYMAYEDDEPPPATILSAARRVAARVPLADDDDAIFHAIDRERLARVLRNSWPVDNRLLEQMEHAHESLNARSEIEPPRSVKPDLRSWLDVLQDLLRRGQRGPTGARIRSMAARAADHLGYLSFRDLRRAEAASYYAQCGSLAREAGDDHELAVLILRQQRLVAAMHGLPAAVDLVENMDELLNPGSPSGITAWRWGERARQESLLGNELAARRYLDLAMSAADRDPNRLNLFAADKDSRWLQRRPAYVALHLGHAAEAIEILERNRHGSDPAFVRETIWNSVELAEAWAIHGDLSNACDYLNNALAMAVSTEDIRALSSIRKIRAKRLTQWEGDSRLRTLDDHLRSASLCL